MRYVQEAALGAAGLAFLMMFFRAVHTRWPESYFTIKDVTSYKISTTPVRYCLFRFGPVLVTSFLLGSVADVVGASPGRAITVMAMGHIVISSGRATAKTLGSSPAEFARSVRLVIYVVVSVGIGVAGFLGWLLVGVEPLRELVPESTDLTASLWTAAAAGVIGSFLIVISRGDAPSTREVLTRSRATFPASTWKTLEEEAERTDANLALVRAIALVENLQRPGWIRSLERAKGKFIPKGTYGVMQVGSDAPVSDEESVRLAVDHWFRSTRGAIDDEKLSEVLRSYNPDPTFRDLARDFFYELGGEVTYGSDEFDENSEPVEISTRQLLIGAGALAGLGGAVGYLIRGRFGKRKPS